MVRWLAVFFLGAVGLRAQQVIQQTPAQQAGQAPTGGRTQQPVQMVPAPVAGGSVTGHIFCGDTHAPAHLARVNLTAVPQASADSQQGRRVIGRFGGQAIADMNGEFVVTGVAAGNYYVDVTMPGYISPSRLVAPQDFSSTDPEAQARVRAVMPAVTLSGGETARVDVTVERGSAITGRAFFDDGTPASNVFVSASPSTDAASTVQRGLGFRQGILQFRGSAQTDDRGIFRIAGLPPGEYVVVANLQIPASSGGVSPQVRGANVTTSLMVYSPGTFAKSDADKITVGAADERTGLEIAISLKGLHTVAGHVSTSQSDNSYRWVMLNGKDVQRGAPMNADGSFRLEEVPDGDYMLSMAGGPRSGGTTAATVPVSVHGGDVTDVALAQ